MNENYSDEETLELQEDDQPSERWQPNNTTDRIRRSCASTDIAALMDTEMDEDSGREEMEEHSEALPQKWIDFYKAKFLANANSNRWAPPAVLEDRFRELLDRAVQMCETGHADGTVDMFVQDCLGNLFRKWYYSHDAVDHWPVEIFHDIGETVFKVVRMLRGLIVAGAGSRDINVVLWELFHHVSADIKPNLLVGDRLHQMNVEVDESAEAELIKPEHVNLKYFRMLVLVYDSHGFDCTAKFFADNITASTSIDELNRYLKAFRMMAFIMNHEKAYAVFASLVYHSIQRLTNATEEELSCKNLRGPLNDHPLFSLYASCKDYVYSIAELNSRNHNMLILLRWRLRFLLKALNEAPFNGRMGAVENLTYLVHEFHPFLHGIESVQTLMKWLEEDRAVDMLTRDNLHNASYVDRVQKTILALLQTGIFTTSDLSTVWEAQRGKHDVIQRNLAELIVRIVPHFDNDLLEGLFLKIQAGWLDGGVRERDMLIDIVRRIGENSAHAIRTQRCGESDQALVDNSLKTIWQFIRQPGPGRENEQSALQAHLTLLDDSRCLHDYLKMFAEMCSADIQAQNEMSATAASHLVHILELVEEDEEEDDFTANICRMELVGSLELSHALVHSLCANIAKNVRRTDDADLRKASLAAFLNALAFALQQNKDLKLTEKHASELWLALIVRSSTDDDKRLGFKFFLDMSEVMDMRMLERFFDNYVLRLPPAHVSYDGYQCFEAFFKAVNEMEGKAADFYRTLSPDNLQGALYVRELMLQGQPRVYERASNLWVEYLHKIIEKAASPAMTASLVQSLVGLITEQYATMAVAVEEARARGMDPLRNPMYELTKERTMRCIKVLSLLVNGMDEEVGVARRSQPALGRSAIGRPIYVSCKIPRREWESVPYQQRGNSRADDFDTCMDVHENTTVAELRDQLKKQLTDKMTRKRSDAEEILESFLLVHLDRDGVRKLHFTDYKRTLGEMGLTEVADVEVRLRKSSGSPTRQGEISPDTSTSEGDWMSPEDMADDLAREAILPSKALSTDEGMVDRLLQVAESEDVDIAMAAFRLLTMVPQNVTKLAQLFLSVLDEDRLRNLLENTSDSRFLYYLMMLEAMILPAEQNLREESYPTATKAMMMFVRVIPHIGQLNKLMNRSVAFRSLAIISITHILHLACMTATRVLVPIRYARHQQMSSLIISMVRLNDVDLPIKWSRHMRTRRLSAAYSEYLLKNEPAAATELLELMENRSRLVLDVLCGVILSAASFATFSPLAKQSETVLERLIGAPLPLLDEATMDLDPCTVPALLECAVYAVAMLAAGCFQQCAEFIGAVRTDPDDLWVHTLMAAVFYKTENVRVMSWSLCVGMIEVVRSSIETLEYLPEELGQSPMGHVSLTDTLLGILPACRGADRYAEQFVMLVKECVKRMMAWAAQMTGADVYINQGVQFLEEALLHSNAEQTPFPDETYLRARIEVLRMLIRYTTAANRERLGSAPDGPRLCERLLADFIFPAAHAEAVAAAAAAAGDAASSEADQLLPRSSTHMEMNSSSSLFELRGGESAGLPRSLSALPISSTRRVAVCSGEGSQDGAFTLLLALCDGVPQNQMLMQTTIHRLFYTNPWTDKKDFDYMPQHILRGEGDLVGLKNGGATCYMNSIFQQLFMIDEVREAVLNASIPEKVLLERRTSDSSTRSIGSGAVDQPAIISSAGGGAGGEAAAGRGDYAVKVLAAVQTLFAHLLGSELESYRPAEFWKVFNFKPNGESVNVREQQDAVEFHNMVTELIDEGLKKCGGEAMCEKTFRGVYADEKICKDCPHRYTKEEPFESLSLDVRSHNNLRDSLKEYVKGDVLENDNAYHCELCNKKVKAIKRMSIAKLPEVLIVQLKRFDFDWEKEISVKFNDYFEFPFEMDIHPYTLEGLEKLEKGQPLEANRDYQYMLRGVVVHSGQAQGGHYTSYIRNRESGKWFKFDDNDVTLWDATEMGAQQRWFGCSDNGLDSMGRGGGGAGGRRKVRTTYWNAYMLFYEKLETANRYLSVNPSSVASDMSTSSGVSSMTTTLTAILSTAVSGSPASPTTMTTSGTTVTSPSPPVGAVGGGGGAGAVSPTLRELMGGETKTRSGQSISPVSHLHRHFSSMSLSSARIRMPPRLEEMLREGNRRVQLERVQYSTHYFSFITQATGKALATADLFPCPATDMLLLATMKSFASFIVHNGLFASRDLMNEDGSTKCSFRTWHSHMKRLLASQPARHWFITHVLFSHEIAACFLFASDPNVREFFRRLIEDTMAIVEANNDASEDCLKPLVCSPVAGQLAQSIRLFPRLSHLLANLLGMLPFKHNGAFRSEPIDFYRTIIELVDQHHMLLALVRGGILNNLLSLFSPTHVHTTDLSSLQRRDGAIYEALHRLVALGLRSICTDGNGNPYELTDIVVRRKEMPELKVLEEFLQKNGGQVKFLQHLVELLRRTARSSIDMQWAVDGALYLCWGGEAASGVVIDVVCQSMNSMLTETATEWLIGLLKCMFAMDDGLADARFEHLIFKAQLTSTHAQPSVQGLMEYGSVSESRWESLIFVLTTALNNLPDVFEMVQGSERVQNLLHNFHTFAVCRPHSLHCRRFNVWYENTFSSPATTSASGSSERTVTDSSVTESNGDSTMDEEVRSSVERREEGGGGGAAERERDGRPPSYHSNNMEHLINSSTAYSPGQLSPSARLGAMTLTSTGEKRPLPPAEDDEDPDGYGSPDRKQSIGETMRRTSGAEWDRVGTTPSRSDEYSASSPMDDSDLLISSSRPSTSSVPPPQPPPAYSDLREAGFGRTWGDVIADAVRQTPPPLPPRPAPAAVAGAAAPAAHHQTAKSPDPFVEFVEKHKEE